MMSKQNFNNIYDKYCPLLYGVALDIYPIPSKAEKILIATFKNINDKNITQENYPAYCITLIRLVIKTATELYPTKCNYNFKLSQFEHTPFVSNIIRNNATLQDCCNKYAITKDEGLTIIRNEFSSILNHQHAHNVGRNTVAV